LEELQSRSSTKGETIACLNVIFLLRAVKEQGSLEKIASVLQIARAQIESKYAEKNSV